MGGLSKVMFSEVQGVVLNGGKPVSGAKVRREFQWAWNDILEKDETTTDSAGKFSFPLLSRFSLGSSLLPHEPVISQRIYIDHEGKEYLAWRYFKRDYNVNDELSGKSINLQCELKKEPGYHINKDIFGISTLN